MSGDSATLPEGWSSRTLGELVEPSKLKVEPRKHPDAPYLSLEHIESGTGKIIGRGVGADVTSTKSVFKAGDVLYGKLRPYLNKVCVPDFDGICSTDILVFERTPAIESALLRHFLSLPENVEYANHNSAGVQLPRVSFKALAALIVPVPPPAEQRRIVGKIAALLARVQVVRERLVRVPLILKRLCEAVLAAACNGQLTADWRNRNAQIEASHFMLSRMAAERRERWCQRNPRRNYVEPESVEMEDLPDLPSSWSWTNFDHCSWEITVGHVGPMRDRYVDEGIPFLRSQNVRPLRFDPQGLVFITEEFHAALRKSALNGGEILVTRSGANTGDCCVYPSTAGPANCADLVVTRPLSGLLAEYGAIYVASPDGQARIGLRQTGIAQPHFNIGAMRVKPFPLPPLAEQREIVRRTTALVALADAIEHRLSAAAARSDKLTQAILSKAFRGELVPTEADLACAETRDYETAEQLLGRIAGLKTASTKPARTPREGRKPVEHSIDIGQELPMRTLDIESVLAVVARMKTADFSFDDLRRAFPGDYEGLKEVVFELLQQAEPTLSQRFDERTEEMRLVRRQK